MEVAEEPVKMASEASSTTTGQEIDSGKVSGHRELTHFTRRPRPSDLPLRLHTWPPPWYRERDNECGDDKGRMKKIVGRRWRVERMEKVQCADEREDGWGKGRRCEVIRGQRDDVVQSMRQMEEDEKPRQETVARKPRLPQTAVSGSLQDGVMRASGSKSFTIREDHWRTKRRAHLDIFDDTANSPYCDLHPLTARSLGDSSSFHPRPSSECAARQVEVLKGATTSAIGSTRGSQLAIEAAFSNSERKSKVEQECGGAFLRTTSSSSTLTLGHQCSVDDVQLHFSYDFEGNDVYDITSAAGDEAILSTRNAASTTEHSLPLPKAPEKPMACRPADQCYSHPVCVPLSRSNEKLQLRIGLASWLAVSLGFKCNEIVAHWNLDAEDDPDIPWTWRCDRGEDEVRAQGGVIPHRHRHHHQAPSRRNPGLTKLEIRIPSP